MNSLRSEHGSGSSFSGPITWCFVYWLVVATMLGAALRLHQLDQPSFWHDELMTIRDVINPHRKHILRRFGYLPTELGLRAAGVDVNALDSEQPQRWRSAGVTERSARLGSCLIGLCTIPLLGLAARRIMPNRAAVVFALLLATGNWHLYWSQTARFYGFQFLWIGLALTWYFQATEQGRMRRLVGALVCFALAFLSHFMAVLVGAVLLADWLICVIRRQPLRLTRYGLAIMLTTIVAAPATVIVLWLRQPKMFEWFMRVDGHGPGALIAGVIYMIGPVTVVTAALGALMLYRKQPRLTIYLALTATAPTLLLSVMAMMGWYAHVRYGFFCYFGWAALAALAMDRLCEHLRSQAGRVLAWTPLAMLLTASMLTNVGYFLSGGGHHPRWREAYEYVALHYQNGDRIISHNDELFLDRYYLGYHLRDQYTDVEQAGPIIDMKKNPGVLDEITGRAWIIVRSGTATHGRPYSGLAKRADLQLALPLRLVQPYAEIEVYRYDGPGRRHHENALNKESRR